MAPGVNTLYSMEKRRGLPRAIHHFMRRLRKPVFGQDSILNGPVSTIEILGATLHRRSMFEKRDNFFS
jgi:hypothetical protein